MINFTNGTISLGAKKIHAISDYEDINTLAEDGLIVKREDGVGTYYYAEFLEDGMKFGLFIRLRERRVYRLVLRWLDGPCTSKGWEGVSEKALKNEYRLLLNLVEKNAEKPADDKRNRERTWHFKWGKIAVSYEPRDFAVAIFMQPR